jgi:hypothetical protein
MLKPGLFVPLFLRAKAFLLRCLRRIGFLFFKQVLCLNCHPLAITCAGKTDGGGAQWHALLSVIAFSRFYRIPYRHTLLASVEHGPLSPHSWLSEWNYLFDLSQFGIESAPINPDPLPCSGPLDCLRMRFFGTGFPHRLVRLEHAHAFTNLYPHTLAALRPTLRQSYRPKSESASPPLALDQALIVHVRRGDVSADGPHRNRYTSAVAIEARCLEILNRFTHLKSVLLLSPTPDLDLIELANRGFLLDCDHDVFTHFHWMSCAAALLMARSSLSYLAGMLNPNLVFYDQFEHPPLSGWLTQPRLA